MNTVVPIEQARPNIQAGARPLAIVPQSMEEAYRLAKAVCLAGMAPRGLETPEKAMVAIMHGLEIGLTPMASLQRIAVVNGRPTIWGDGAIGLVRGSGLCEYIRETITGSGDAMAATCETKRRGEPEPIVRTFTVADAKKAGLWGKQGPWQQFPQRMLQMRARGFCLRDVYSDVLGGLYLREELDEEHRATQARDVTPPAPPPPPAVESGPAPVALPPPPPAEESSDPEQVFKDAETMLGMAQSKEAQDKVWETQFEPLRDKMFPPDADHLVSIYERLDRRWEPE